MSIHYLSQAHIADTFVSNLIEFVDQSFPEIGTPRLNCFPQTTCLEGEILCLTTRSLCRYR